MPTTLLRKPQRFLSKNIRVMDPTHARWYFSDYGEEEAYQVRRYWQTYASRKELIDFGSRRTKVRYFYNDDTKKYYRQVYGLRKFAISNHYIKLDVTRFANNICKLQREYTQAFINGRTSVQDWYDGTVRLMKYSYKAGIDIARGSSGEMFVEEQREFSRITSDEMDKFNLYAKQIAAGDIPIDGRILNSVCSLGRRINRIFENWKLWDAKKSGFTQARRRLTVAEHCRDSESRDGCIKLARQGWKSIDTIIPIGGATCWDGCLCEMEYR